MLHCKAAHKEPLAQYHKSEVEFDLGSLSSQPESLCGTCYLPRPPIFATTSDPAYLVHVDGGEQVLEHSGHELHVHAVGAKVVEHQEGWVGELLLMHAVAAQ